MLGISVVSFSLLLVFLVGYGQALKSYRELSVDTVMAQAEAARLGIEQNLNSGVHLDDIAGLKQVLQPIVDADSSVTGLRLLSAGKQIYLIGEVSEFDTSVSIALKNKFTEVGELQLVLSDELVEALVTERFKPALWLVLILLAVFITCVLKSNRRAVYLSCFSIIFLVMSVSVMLLAGSLYRDGLQSKALSLSDVLSQRLAPILVHNVDPNYVFGIEAMLDNFRETNPDIAKISVFNHSQLVAVSQNQGNTVRELSDNDLLDYRVATSASAEVLLVYKVEVVFAQLLRTLKNFAVLFFACGLVCFAFIRLLSGGERQGKNDQVLERIKPLFLGAVLMEALMAPLMPQFMGVAAESLGLGAGASSIFFSIYFLSFALSLLPASRLIEVYDIRRVLIGGILLSSLGCLLLIFNWGVSNILFARLLSGVGQAFIFIAVQGYILRFSDKSNKTQAAGIIVFCFNAGFIAGVAIGALLADYLGDQGTFALAAVIGLLMSLFSFVLPSMKSVNKRVGAIGSHFVEMVSDSWRLIKIPSFLRTMLLVGIPTKMALTGIVAFAVPLLLAERGISKEIIGQVLMSYATLVLIVSHRAGRWVDKLGSSKKALTIGNFLAGIALMVLAYAVLALSDWQLITLMSISMMLLGFSHGLINAPVVTHVVNITSGAESDSVIASTYRFLERIGHVAGAIIVAQLLLWLGAEQAMLVMAGLFMLASFLFTLFDKSTVKGGR